MSIVDLKSDLFRDELAGGDVPNSNKVRGVNYIATGRIVNGANDLSGSTYLIARLPSHALMDFATGFNVAGWGFVNLRLGTLEDPSALFSVTVASSAVRNPISKFAPMHGRPFWEQMGLASDPGGEIPLYVHAIEDATGAGEIEFYLVWREK